jgi:hypothetical protein
MRSTGSTCLDATIAMPSETAEDPGVRAAPSDAQAADEAAERATAAELVASLLALGAIWPGDEHTRRRLVLAAVAHGMERRGQGDGEEVIFSDYDRLRATVWAHIRRSDLPPGRASQSIVGIDAAISLAVAGSLRGFYRDVIAQSGEWPLVVERLVWEWRHHAHPQGA